MKPYLIMIITIFSFSQFCYGNIIGANIKQCDEIFGKPYSLNLELGYRLYHFGVYNILVNFKNGKASKILYDKKDDTDFSTEEAAKIMQKYGNGKKWDIYRKEGDKPWKWIRQDKKIIISNYFSTRSIVITIPNKQEQKFNGEIIIDEPAPLLSKNRTTLRGVEDETLSDDISPIWFEYVFQLFAHATWNAGNHREFNNKFLIPTFEEELKARQVLIDKWKKEKTKNSKLKDKYLDELLLVDKAGFMHEYVWTYLKKPSWKTQPEKLNLKNFVEWDKKNLKNHKVETHGHIKVTTGLFHSKF